jgi:hypothetical protein
VSTIFALALLAGAPEAGPAVGFEWDAPAQCPTADEVEAMVHERVGAPVHEDGQARLDVIARVRRSDDGGWALRLWVIDEDGTHRRDLEDDDCAVLAEAAATMVAVFVAPQQPEPEPKPEPEPDPDPEPEPEPEPTPEPKPEPAPEPAPVPTGRRLGGDLRAHGHFELGALRGPAGGFALAGNLDLGRARIELVARGSFAPPIQLAGGGSAALQLWSAGLRGGFVPRWDRVELSLTGGLDVGALSARAADIPAARGGNVAWAAAVLGPALVVRPVPRLGLWLGVDGWVAILRPRIVLDDGTDVHQPAPGGFRASLGLSVRFGDGAIKDSPARRQPTSEAR